MHSCMHAFMHVSMYTHKHMWAWVCTHICKEMTSQNMLCLAVVSDNIGPFVYFILFNFVFS